MARDPLVVRTKFLSPVPRKQLLKRPGLMRVLDQIVHHPVTILRAGPGYGKSTGLAVYLADRRVPSFWYSVGEPDSDPHIFVLHLVWALRITHPAVGSQALVLLEGDHDCAARRNAIDSLANDILDHIPEDSVFVIDDYHLAARNPEVNEIVERLINTMPPKLHVVLSTRKKSSFESLARWRVKGEVLEVSEKDLAFTSDEIRDLFLGPYDCSLTAEQFSCYALPGLWVRVRCRASLMTRCSSGPSRTSPGRLQW